MCAVGSECSSSKKETGAGIQWCVMWRLVDIFVCLEWVVIPVFFLVFGNPLPFAMLLLVLVALVDHPAKVSDDSKDDQGDKDIPDKEPVPALVRFALDQLTGSVDRLVATVVLTADLGNIGRRDRRIVLVQTQCESIALPGGGTTLSEGGSWLALALHTGQMRFAIGEEGVPVGGHLVIARKQKIFGEGVVDQIVNHQG